MGGEGHFLRGDRTGGWGEGPLGVTDLGGSPLGVDDLEGGGDECLVGAVPLSLTVVTSTITGVIDSANTLGLAGSGVSPWNGSWDRQWLTSADWEQNTRSPRWGGGQPLQEIRNRSASVLF